jgi:dienelactone hydrolase
MANPLPKDIRPAFPQAVPRTEIRAKYLEILGLDELPETVEFEIVLEGQEGSLRLTRVEYRNSLGEKLEAVILAPSGTQALPGVVCMHGTSGSIENVIAAQLRSEHVGGGQLLGWARALAQRGYATMSISLKGSVVRRGTAEAWEEEAKCLEAYGRPQMGIMAEEVLRATRVLAQQPYVEANRIGLTGMSLGGLGSWVPMACEPRIRTAVAICGGLGSLAQVIHYGNVERHSSFVFPPHFLRYFDQADIVAACIAPRPFMMVAPTEDEDMPKAGVDGLIPMVRAVYAEHGNPEDFRVVQPAGRHVFTVEHFKQMVAWFGQYL